jgi:hypothetical protein
LRVSADPSTPRPGGGAPFTWFSYATIQSGEYAFASDGLYRTENGTLVHAADPTGIHVHALILDGDQLWFPGLTPRGAGGPPSFGVHRVRNGSVGTIVFTGDPNPAAPSGYTFQLDEYSVAARGGRAIFRAPSADASGAAGIVGFYKYEDAGITRVVDTTMRAPGGDSGARFSGFDTYAFDYDGQNLAFFATATGSPASGYPMGLYLERDGVFRAVAFNYLTAPGGGSFNFQSSYSRVSVDQGHVAFTSITTYGPSAIYSDWAGTLERIVGTGDVLFGQTVAEVRIGGDALSAGQIVFRATFTNGNSGIYIATIPEPSGALTATLGVTFGLIHTRRKLPR